MTTSLFGNADLIDSRYREAVNLFNQQQWYLAHDAFEDLWYETHGSFRSLLQGIIQISVAEYHLDNGNTKGATLLMAEGLNHLKSAESLDIALDLVKLKAIVQCRLSALQSGQALLATPLPVLMKGRSDD